VTKRISSKPSEKKSICAAPILQRGGRRRKNRIDDDKKKREVPRGADTRQGDRGGGKKRR